MVMELEERSNGAVSVGNRNQRSVSMRQAGRNKKKSKPAPLKPTRMRRPKSFPRQSVGHPPQRKEDVKLNTHISQCVEGLTVWALVPAALDRQRKPFHMDRQVFRIPTSRAKPSIVAFRPIKAIP